MPVRAQLAVLKVESLKVMALRTCIDGLASTLEQQQLIKGLKDIDGWLMNSTHNGPPRVHNVTHSPHDNGRCPGVQPWTTTSQQGSNQFGKASNSG